MSGVVIDGVQYERCNQCGEWVRFEYLCYEEKSKKFPYGRELCNSCFTKITVEKDGNTMKTERGNVVIFFLILLVAAVVIIYTAYTGISELATGESNLFATMLNGLAEVLK